MYKWVLYWYIKSSLHAAFAIYALTQLTVKLFHLPNQEAVSCVVFFGAFCSYNFIKYYDIWILKKRESKTGLKILFLFFLISFCLAVYYCFQLNTAVKLLLFALFLGSSWYVMPVPYCKKGVRSVPGIKIFFVAACLSITTVLLPLLQANYVLNLKVFVFLIQRFFLIVVLIIPFEIKDVFADVPTLRTLPQVLGVKKTKVVAYCLLVFCAILDFYCFQQTPLQGVVAISFLTLIAFFVFQSSPSKPKLFTDFWLESLPIVWWLSLLLLIN